MLDIYEHVIDDMIRLLVNSINGTHENSPMFTELITGFLIKKNRMAHRLTEAQHRDFHDLLAAIVAYRYSIYPYEEGGYDHVILVSEYIPEWFLTRITARA